MLFVSRKDRHGRRPEERMKDKMSPGILHPRNENALRAHPLSVVKSAPIPMLANCNPWLKSANPLSPPKLFEAAAPSTMVRPRILIIDDELLDMQLIGGILGEDYVVMFANNGLEALEIATIKAPDLILLDVMLPGMDGFEVYQRLQADRRTSEIPVIFITAVGDVAAETKGLNLGAVDFITKPINPGPIKARVNTQIRLKMARDKFAQMAATDGLTGLANRSYFDAMLAYEFARHARSGSTLSLILLDIDHFKLFNDTYGHVCGDECLRMVARAISGVAVRATDFVARFGGEEFVLLLPETHLEGAVTMAHKVRKCIEDLAIPHLHSSNNYVSASLGVACSRQLAGSTATGVVEEADAQLYIAKAAGRNRVSSRPLEARPLMQAGPLAALK